MAPIKRQRNRSILDYLQPKKAFEFVKSLLFEYQYFWLAVLGLLIAEILVNILVIWKVPYTEIDWQAYMDEVEGFLNGTYDYTKLQGGTGPLVYPAGFVYIFSGLYYMTDRGINIRLAQYIFCFLYLCFIGVIFYIYYKSQKVPPYAMFFVCCASYRIHSIFILRLFNDPVAMLLFYVALVCFLSHRWTIGCVLFSVAVSIKMNVLLFAPGLAILLFHHLGAIGAIKNISVCAIIQLILGFPFLLDNPHGYIIRSFNLGRQFFYKWTVNWRLIPEWLFLSRYFQVALLSVHMGLLVYFILKLWPQPKHGWFTSLFSFKSDKKQQQPMTSNQMIYVLFTSNFIGMACSRSLHYQFYVWYFHTLPFLLWSIKIPSSLRLLILGIIELCWNTYPSTMLSSSMLHVAHLCILLGLMLKGNHKEDSKKVQ